MHYTWHGENILYFTPASEQHALSFDQQLIITLGRIA